MFVLVGADETNLHGARTQSILLASSASALQENNTTVMLQILCQPTAVEEVRRGGGGGDGGGRGTAGIENDKRKNSGTIHRALPWGIAVLCTKQNSAFYGKLNKKIWG